jgi:hypothetical protein
MFMMPRRSRSTRRISPTTRFAHCITRAKTTARGFWAWLPEVPLDLSGPRLSVPSAASTESGADSYCETIVAAAARVHSAT